MHHGGGLQCAVCCGVGQVTEKHTEKATIESKGKQITKNGEPENPAFKVERKGKNPVIKKVYTDFQEPNQRVLLTAFCPAIMSKVALSVSNRLPGQLLSCASSCVCTERV